MQFTVILYECAEGGYWVEVPSLPGCFSQGETVEESLENIRAAIHSHIQALRKDGVSVPTDSSFVLARVEVAV